ncbi:MAG TPA: C25 family cysteine peptidase [Planctomycetota bacterium]|nr:C25 family cysteine peptidase [Planctomycetota bacterium]
MYVTDSSDLLKWTAATQQVSTLVSGFNGLYGVAVDATDNLYLADSLYAPVKKVTFAFVGPASTVESAAAGSDSLLPVIPTTTPQSELVATSDQTWLTLGTLNAGVQPFSFTANTGPLPRTAHITVLGQSLTVTQKSPTPVPATIEKIAGDKQGFVPNSSVGTLFQVQVFDQNGDILPVAGVSFTPVAGSTGASGIFNASPPQPIVTDASGFATAPLFTANANSGTFTVSATAGNASNTFNVLIAPATYLLGNSGTIVGPAAGMDTFALYVSPSNAPRWTSAAVDNWLHLATPYSSGIGSSTLQFTYDANPSTVTRTGTLTIQGQAYTVTQAGSNYVGTTAVTTLAQLQNAFLSGVTVDHFGNVWFTDAKHDSLKRWSAASQQIDLLETTPGFPRNLAVDSANNIYCCGSSYLTMYSSSGLRLNTISTVNTESVAADSMGDVYFLDNTFGDLFEWTAGTQQTATLVTGPMYSEGIALDPGGNVYIADTQNNAVLKWDSISQTLSNLFSTGTSSPAVAADGFGNIYFSVYGSVQKWNAATQQTTVAIGLGAAPNALTFDELHNLYVSNGDTNSVQKITHAFVGPVIVHESAQAGSDALLPVLPTATPLNGIFAPMSDQSWLTIGTVSNGVISFSFTANTGTTSRTANITVLGQNIALTQDGPPNYTWNGGNGTWAVGTGGWDMGNWVDGNNAIIGNGTDTAGTIMVTSTVNPANITFNPPQTGAYTLAVNGAIAAGNPIAISAGAAMRGTGNIGRTIQPSSTGVIWPGSATVGSAVPAGGETLTVAGLDMSGGGTLKIALNASSTSSTQQLAVTGTTCTLGGTLSLGAPAGTSSGNAYTILSSSSNSITGAFAAIKLNGVTVSGSSPVTVQYSANAVTVTLTAGATPVTIDSFSAKAEGLGVALKWHSVSEYLNAGYNVYRRPHPRPVPPEGLVENGGADWTRVNATLIGGLITNADGKTYRLYDWPAPGAYEYRLESVSIHGVRENFRTIAGPIDVDGMGDLSVNVSTIEGVLAGVQNELSGMNARAASATFAPFSTGVARSAVDPTKPVTDVRGSMRASPQEAGAPAVRDLSGGGVASRTLASDGVANVRSTAASSRADLSPALAARWFSSNNAVQARGGMLAAKVQYVQPGVLAIPQASLPAGFDVHRVAVQREGRAMPVLAIENNTLYLYAPGYSDDYTDTDALFLRSTPAATAAGSVTFASGLFSGGKPAMTSTPASVTASYHDVYFDYNTAYRPYTFAPWFSSQYLTDGSDQQFSLSAPFAGSGAASLTVTLWSLTSSAGAANDHALQVLINGQPVGQTQWSGGQKMMELTFQIPAGVLTSGANQIELVTPVLDGVASQVCFVHALTVNYARVLDGSQPVTLTNAGNFAQLFELSNLPSANVWVVDTRFADRAALVPYKAQAQNDGTYRVRFDAAGGGTGQFLVVPYGQENAPTAVRLRTLKPLKATAYLATGPAAFGAGVQPLLMKHAKEGLRGQFVDQEELFDYYNSGRYGPAGIQNAVRSVRPQYLLLVGRTTYDYHNYSGAGVDPLCPAFLVSTTLWSQTTSDSMFGDLGRGYPEVAVGRLPVNNPNELGGAVQHVMGNAGLGTGWRLHAAADRADPAAGDFAAEADAIAQAHPELSWQRNYLGITCQTAPEVTAALTAAANGGADILMYVGHGNAVRLGNEVPRILDNDSVAAWTGYCVFLQSTCTANWMAKDEAGYQSIAIQALTQPQGGISASIASSTYMNSEDATEFMNQLLDNAGTTQRWGNVLLRAQQWAYARGGGLYDDLSRTEQIFGDPAMPIYSKTSKAAPAAATSAGAF